MKTFASITLLVASVAVSSAQFTIGPSGDITCTGNPNGNYCASSSLSSNIIIRCNNGVGQAGNCNDNLAGEPPLGVNYSPCWETSETSGDAACSKNCVVYANNGTLTLTDCTPVVASTSSSSAVSPTSYSTASSSPTASSYSLSQKTSSVSSTSSVSASASSTPLSSSYNTPSSSVLRGTGGNTTTSLTVTSTVTTICSTGASTWTSTYTTTNPKSTMYSSVVPIGTGTGTGSGPSAPSGNGTASTSGSSPSGTATAIPTGPKTTGTSPFTGGATANRAGAVLAAGGLFVAYFL